ncbi:MAG: flagellar hook-length control protein FliK [Bacillota bacterium]|nr:flagellar hook-length control protein FliK [Bacillota bacterium]
MDVNVTAAAVNTLSKPIQPQSGDTVDTKNAGVDSKDKTLNFSDYYKKYSNDSTDSENVVDGSDKKTKGQALGAAGILKAGNPKNLKDKSDTMEDLIALLVNLYMAKGEITPTKINSDQTGNIITQDGKAVTSGKIKLNGLQDLVKNIMTGKEIPTELKEILEQYMKLTAQNTKTFNGRDGLKNSSKIMDLFPGLSSTLSTDVAKTDGADEFKKRVVDEIKNLLGDTEVKDKLVKKHESLSSKRTVSTLEKLLAGDDIKVSDKTGSADKKTDYAEFKATTNLSDNAANKKTLDSEDDKILKGILQDDSTKKEVKLNMVMDLMNKSKSADLEPTVQSGQVTVHKATIVNDMVKAVKFMDNNQIKELKVNINPKELGELIVSVTMEDGKIKASISAGSKDAYNLLTSNLNEMKNSLNSTEIRIQDVSVGIYNGDTTFFRDGSQRQGNDEQNNYFGGSGRRNAQEDEVSIKSIDDSRNDGQINLLA